MFKRVQFEEWQAIITTVAFFLCFITFLYFCWRATRMSKGETKHMAQLPLENDQTTALSSHEQSQE
jgi:cbb3-type cytochrome oxidase subunit 3